eukprot:CAMPEP_0196139444 /NCGR_PEP_ID=MMETSP0910-20130528/6711_1 /TAXON_ID=49265 /ORGANISM="Thalassiosira rotula, Strain GSO102" /LENGTH=538 /DNA_ID=CAMNT_0041400163 /DNA_START=142 /DNA_END=1758 /DNA_ORIENTATION=-
MMAAGLVGGGRVANLGRLAAVVGVGASKVSKVRITTKSLGNFKTARVSSSMVPGKRLLQRCHSCANNNAARANYGHGGPIIIRCYRPTMTMTRNVKSNLKMTTSSSASRRQSSTKSQQKRSSTTFRHRNHHHHQHATPTSHPILRLLLQSLQHALLKPRSLPLPRYISPQHYSFTLSEVFGHSSFILVAASYATQDFLELRVMAVLGSTSMLFFTYFHPHGRVLWLPLKWNLLFIAINSYRVGKVLFDRFMADGLCDELKEFREEHLNVVDVVDWYKLVRISEEEVFEEGDLVLQQGRANHFIRIVLEGELEVLRDGTLTYVVEKGNFVSESGLHAGLMLTGSIESCGTIVCGPPFDPTESDNNNNNCNGDNTQHHHRRENRVRCLRWNRNELMELLENDKGLRNALQAALSWDIVRKLKMQRKMLSEGRVKDPTVWTKKREDQGISRYASILQNMLHHPEEFGDMSEVLAKYRRIHHVGDEDHKRALAKCGWTEEEFRSGKRHDVEDDEDIDAEEFESARWRRVKRYSSKVVRSLLQ